MVGLALWQALTLPLRVPVALTLGLLLPLLVLERVRRGEPVPLLRRVALPVPAPALCDGADWERLADAVMLTVVVVEGQRDTLGEGLGVALALEVRHTVGEAVALRGEAL